MKSFKPIEIFCGTGGVGKTTLASSRALYLAHQGAKVLLITIDPAKRLKQVLKMEDSAEGEVKTIPCELFIDKLGDIESAGKTFDALLLSPAKTFQKISEHVEEAVNHDNIILKTLTKPYGGMNEIMAIVEVERQLKTGLYDTIVLDTPPGKHFIDFLDSSKKIQRFFDSSFVDIFRYMGKNVADKTSAPTKFLKSLISSGVKKLLSYLEKVTGKDFVEVFVDAVINIYRNKDGFIEALQFGEKLKNKNFSNWYLVTSVDQMKLAEATSLKNSASDYMHEDSFLALNRCLERELTAWDTQGDSELERFKQSMLGREMELKKYAQSEGETVLEFSEIFQINPEEHVAALATQWQKS